MSELAKISARVRIYGKVQGVWFRAWTVHEAEAAGVAGWVRNRVDGSVEASFHGEAAAVRTMIERCRQGPPKARVERVEETVEPEPVTQGFTQRPTR